jgi:hypothetical protein
LSVEPILEQIRQLKAFYGIKTHTLERLQAGATTEA